MFNEVLEQKAFDKKLNLYDVDFIDDIDGLIVAENILLSKNIETTYKRNRVLAHEMNHVETCPFNLINAPQSTQNKYENIANRMIAEEYLPVSKLIQLAASGASCIEDVSNEIEIDVQFVEQIFTLYQNIYGYNYRCGEYVVLSFVPFYIICADEI